MKFAQKLTVAILLLLSLTLSVGGAWTIQQNFAHALRTVEQQDAALHQRECYGIESALSAKAMQCGEIADISSTLTNYTDYQHAEFGESGVSFAVFDENGTPVYSNMPQGIPYALQWKSVQQGRSAVQYYSNEGETFLLMASPLRDFSLSVVNAYPVTAFFDERDRQLYQYLVLEGVVLILAGIAAVAISALLTRPMRRLEVASRRIAKGDYNSRVKVTTLDEIGQLGKSFNTMADAVQDQMEALQQETQRQKRFVGAFTHELKTPMTAILGYADMLRSGEQPAEKRQKGANYIYHEAKRLEALSRELLSLLGMEHDGITLKKVSLQAVLGDVQRSLPELPVQLDINCPENAMVMADRTLLADLVRNLVLNASHAQPSDNRVEVGCTRKGKGWILWVRDQGCGIPKEELDKIMEPFYRVDKSRARKNGGNGLGLSLCAQIAEAHGSPLRISSELGKGTIVGMMLKEAEKE